ncbi:ead/Ea22-like family protein [Salmonella enterica subsp. salamae]|nr:ead/Ea22-like family protein [Salmonella enterica]ECJ5920236.1 ead/Ea22-like family protein [Salmonella enterica subsp. salamae]ECN5160595.1 ead/Ea22-like family protein [Salmonella enterica subsp. enterica serovar Newport]EDD8833846.1 ead/Ea22-like family protein [Salmonella enterica subsp. enterica serovar Mikawasima]EBP4576573.1 ead/Ea22-like family protein [Salmonella enterica]
MTIDKQALREAATVATQGGWYVDYDFDVCHESGAFLAEAHGDNLAQNAKFIAAANPATMLALLDENIQLQREKDAIEAVALALRDDMRQSREKLEAAERRIAELETRAVSIPEVRITVAESKRRGMTYLELNAHNSGALDALEIVSKALTAAGIKVKGE